MPIITSIKSQRSKKRVNIYLDGKFGFGLDLETLVKLGLKVEQELTDEEIKRIVEEAEFSKTLNKLLKFATLRPRSKKEIKDWFYRKKVHESLQKKLFNRLKRLDLVDDERFAAWWVEQRTSFRPKSKRELVFELRQKGIGKDFVERAIEKANIDEVKIARSLLKKRKHQDWKKNASYLARRGFDWEVIKRVK